MPAEKAEVVLGYIATLEEQVHLFEENEKAHRAVYQQTKAENARLLEALKGVVRVADRKTVEFDAARAAIAEAETQSPTNAAN